MSHTFLWSNANLKRYSLLFLFLIPSLVKASDSSAQLWGAWSRTAPNTFNQTLLADPTFSSTFGAGLDLKWGVTPSFGLGFRGEIWEWAPAGNSTDPSVNYQLHADSLLLGINLHEPSFIDSLSFELGLYAGLGLTQFDRSIKSDPATLSSWYADFFLGEVSIKLIYELYPHYQTFLMGMFRYAQNAQFSLVPGSNDPPVDLSGPAIAYGIGYIF